MAHGKHGHHGVTVVKRVTRDHVFETGHAVTLHQNMEEELVQEIIMKTCIVI